MSTLEFNHLVKVNSPSLHSFAYNFTKNVEDAEDLLQDTVLKALRYKENFQDGTNFKGWLFTIMRNIFINNYKRKKLQNLIQDGQANEFFVNNNSTAFDSVTSQINEKDIRKAISELTDEYKTPFQMFVEGFERAIEIDLFSLAAGFYVLSGAIAAFGASMAIGGMASFLGGGMMLQLVALAAISPGLILASDALSSIGATLQMFKDETIVEGIENITEAVKGLNKEINNVSLLNIAGLSTIGTIGKNATGGGDEVVSKLDELIELMKSGGIAVNIDGSKVSTAVGVATKFRGSF